MDGNISTAVGWNALKLDNRQYCIDSRGPQRINQIFRTLLVFSVMPFTTVRWISITFAIYRSQGVQKLL